jgi:hypothetical protein
LILCVWLHTETQIKTFGHLYYIIPPLNFGNQNRPKSVFFGVSAFSKFSFWQRFASKKTVCFRHHHVVKKPEHTQKEEQ